LNALASRTRVSTSQPERSAEGCVAPPYRALMGRSDPRSRHTGHRAEFQRRCTKILQFELHRHHEWRACLTLPSAGDRRPLDPTPSERELVPPRWCKRTNQPIRKAHQMFLRNGLKRRKPQASGGQMLSDERSSPQMPRSGCAPPQKRSLTSHFGTVVHVNRSSADLAPLSAGDKNMAVCNTGTIGRTRPAVPDLPCCMSFQKRRARDSLASTFAHLPREQGRPAPRALWESVCG
jgi:hypothetical protein